jgi:hypothetical protein
MRRLIIPFISCTLLLLLLCSVLRAQHAAVDLEHYAQKRIESLCKYNPDFQGAWIMHRNLNPEANDGKGVMDWEILVDSSNGKGLIQKELIVRELDKYDFEMPYRISKVYQIGLQSLYDEVNVRISANPKMDGCYVAGGYFGNTDDGTPAGVLNLLGRVEVAEQSDEIMKVCDAILMDSLRGQPLTAGSLPDLRIIKTFLTNELNVKRSNVFEGMQIFSEAIAKYRKCNFAGAENSFQMAVVESPDTPQCRQWHILSLLQQNQRRLAYAYMLAYLVRQKQTWARFKGIQEALETIQGPSRMELLAVQEKARKDTLAMNRLLGNP